MLLLLIKICVHAGLSKIKKTQAYQFLGDKRSIVNKRNKYQTGPYFKNPDFFN